MAAYPTLPTGIESAQEEETSYLDTFSVAGTQHSRQMRSATYYQFTLLHPAITDAEYDSLRSTYAAGPRDTYTLTYRSVSPAVTYSIKFMEPPQIVRNHGGGRYDVRVKVRGTQD